MVLLGKDTEWRTGIGFEPTASRVKSPGIFQ
jgi:hypothetical protein